MNARFLERVAERGAELVCPIQRTISLVADKWKVLIVEQVRERAVRFNELHRALDGVTPRVLSRQLKELEFDGLIVRHDYAEVPPRVEYRLTELGASLLPIFDQLNAWAATHHQHFLAQRQHAAGAYDANPGETFQISDA